MSLVAVYDYISGPNSCTVHYNPDNGKTIYMFGETHRNDPGCPNNKYISIIKYFEILFHTTSVPIDFFLEAPLDYRQYGTVLAMPKHDINTIMNLRIMQVTIYDYLPMVRSHYVDPRITNGGYTDISPFLPIYKTLVRERFEYSELLRTIGKIFQQFIDNGLNSRKGCLDYIMRIIETQDNIISKELRRSNKRKEILEFVKNRVMSIYYQVYDPMMAMINIEPTPYVDIFQMLEKFIITLDGILLDVYCLARIFKRFGTKPGRRPISETFPSEPTNIIVYVGELHAEPIRAFLTSLSYIEVERTSSSTHCLNMQYITQPFFSVRWDDALLIDKNHRIMSNFADDMRGLVYANPDNTWIVKVRDTFYDEDGVVSYVGDVTPVSTEILEYDTSDEIYEITSLMHEYVVD